MVFFWCREVKDQLVGSRADHDLVSPRLTQDHFTSGRIAAQVFPRHLAWRCQTRRTAEGWGKIDIADQPLDTLPRLALSRPLDDQRHLDQRVVHVVAFEQHVVEPQILAVIGRVAQSANVVESFLLEQVISRPT